jgi:hypothetical protein
MAQLDLFGSTEPPQPQVRGRRTPCEALRQAHNKNRKLKRQVARLQKDYEEVLGAFDRAREAWADLTYERAALRQENESLRVALAQWVAKSFSTGSAPGVGKADLTRLLTIAHPDKWHNQPAETLAHELAVAINAMRQGVA